MAIQVVVSERTKAEIARRIIEGSDFASVYSGKSHLRAIVRGMLMEAMTDVVKVVNGIDPTVEVKVEGKWMKLEADEDSEKDSGQKSEE